MCPILAICIFLFFYNEPELGARINPSFPSSIGRGTNPRPPIVSRVLYPQTTAFTLFICLLSNGLDKECHVSIYLAFETNETRLKWWLKPQFTILGYGSIVNCRPPNQWFSTGGSRSTFGLQTLKLCCDTRFQHAFSACGCVFKVNILVSANQRNFFENATTCSKRMHKTLVATQLYLWVARTWVKCVNLFCGIAITGLDNGIGTFFFHLLEIQTGTDYSSSRPKAPI